MEVIETVFMFNLNLFSKHGIDSWLCDFMCEVNVNINIYLYN